jgi:hypothetical protein
MIDTAPDHDISTTEPAAPDEATFLRITREAWTASAGYFDANVRHTAEQDIRQWQSKHLHGSKYLSNAYAGRSRLFVPKTRSAITKSESLAAEAFFSSLDIVNIAPYDKDDPPQVQAADFYKALLAYRLSEPAPRGIAWFLTCIGAYQDGHVTGITISKQYWDKRRDAPAVDLVPIEHFRFDPASDWRDPVGTSPYLIHVLPMYVKDVRARMADGRWRKVADSDLQKGVRGQSDTIRLQRDGNRTDAQDVSHGISDYNIVMVHETIAEIDGLDYVWYSVLTETILSDPVPVTNPYAHGRPFVVGLPNLEAHRHYASSTPTLTRDIQRETNELRNQRGDNVAFVLNKRYFVKRNKQVDLASLMRNVAGSATLMDDPETDVRVVETPDVTSSAFQEQDRLNLDFDEVAGNFSQSSVQGNRNLNETVGGMNMLTTNANQVAAYRLRTFIETWVEPVLRQLCEMERQYESNETIVALAIKQAGIPIEQLDAAIWSAPVQVTVNVGMSATNPQERANLLIFGFNSVKMLLADGALEQRGLNSRELVKEIFAMIGYRDGSRFFKWGEDDPVVAHLQQMVEQLKAQLAQKTPPELVAAQVARYEQEVKRLSAQTVAEGVKAAYSAMQAGQVIASVPSVAPIADEVMKAAGWQPQPGTDPNFPQPAAPDPALMQGDVSDRRTGVSFLPPGNTSPMLPASPGQGLDQGIETPRIDGVA